MLSPAEREEIVEHPYPVQPQYFRHGRGEHALGLGPRSGGTGFGLTVGFRQRGTVQFPVGGQRERVKPHERRGHQLFRQALARFGAKLGSGARCTGEVADQPGVSHRDLGPGDPGQCRERRRHLAGFDPHAADLHLVVAAAEVFENARRRRARSPVR
ncbi:hypothetical protein [Amycolatopsis sp. A1MSW2902]|uniref:hypothetical protein n=1 Tax=Amycolatopsis sp. A1MSW2902 TaxID=687413 RepID=UPI00307F5E6F